MNEELTAIRAEYNRIFDAYMDKKLDGDSWLSQEKELTKRANIIRNRYGKEES